MQSEFEQAIEVALSTHRLQPYIDDQNGNLSRALELYRWNIDISSALYGDLGVLEVLLRNALNKRLIAKFQSENQVEPWWEKLHLPDASYNSIKEATLRAQKSDVPLVGQNDVVSNLTFGFWVGLFTRRYQSLVWPQVKSIFSGESDSDTFTRGAIHNSLENMNFLKNRIAHHEAIFKRDLFEQNRHLAELINLLSPETAQWVQGQSRIEELLEIRPRSK